jgi:hypothetical protein
MEGNAMRIFVKLQDLVDNVTRAICQGGIMQGTSAGYLLADEVRNKMGLGGAPSEIVSVDCHRLWREFVDLQEFYETDPGTHSYRRQARMMLDEVMRGCTAASQR